MKFVTKFLTELGLSIATLRVKDIEVEPPDLIVYYSNGVAISRFFVCKDVDYDIEETTGDRGKSAFEAYVALMKSLPSKTHVYIYKDEFDLESFLRKLKNDILNIQADLELVKEEADRLKLKLKLEKLKSLYNAVIEGKPFLRISLAVVYRVEAKDKSSAKSIADYYEHIVMSVFRNHFGVKLERASYTDIISLIVNSLGLVAETRLPSQDIEAGRLASLQPVVLDNPLLTEPGILIGFEKESKHPVSLELKQIYYHTAIVGPTGRGKSTLLASIIEQVVSEGFLDLIVIDFKGDLKRYIADNLTPILTPNNAIISALEPPPGIEYMSWRRVVLEALSYAGGLNPDAVLEALLAVEKDVKELFKNPSAGAILPFVEFIRTNTSYSWITEYLSRNEVYMLFDLEERGTVFQNTYASLLIGIVRHLILNKARERGLLLIVDDAWRILKLRTLVEIVREGRSKKVAVILSSQSLDDFPSEILENVYNIVVFGSKNEDYISKVRRIIGGNESVISLLPKLNVGEAVYANALVKNARAISIYVPSKMRKQQES